MLERPPREKEWVSKAMAHPFKREQMPLEDFDRMPTMCAWDGCEEMFGRQQ